jgi:hypothetical protein
MQFKGHRQNTSSQIQNTNTKQDKTKPILEEKRNVKVQGQNPCTLKPGNKSLIKTGLQLNERLSLLMPVVVVIIIIIIIMGQAEGENE